MKSLFFVLAAACAAVPAYAKTDVHTDFLSMQYVGLALSAITLQPQPPVKVLRTVPVRAPSVTILRVRVVDPPGDYGGRPPAQLAPWVDPPPQMLPWPIR